MIAKFQEAAEEANQKAFCDKEIGESMASKADKEGKLEKVSSRLEKAESSIATLTEEVSKLSKEVAETEDAKSDGSGILGLLEVAEDDFAKSLAEARTIESTAQSEYNKLTQDGKMLKMTKEMEIKGKQSEIKSLKTTSTDLSSDKEGLTGELDAVLAYLDKLKPQCETKVPSYEERKAAREQEIE